MHKFQTHQSKIQNVLPIEMSHHVEDVRIVESSQHTGAEVLVFL